MKIKNIYRIFVALLLFSNYALGQTNLKFDRVSTTNGLSNNSINCLIEDSKGYMWFGTFDGLNRYDGYKIITYRPNPYDTTSISDNTIRCILEEHLGYIWVGTDKGLNKFDPVTETFKHFTHNANNLGSISDNGVSAICQDQNTFLWFATADGNLNKYDRLKNRFIHYNLPLPKSRIRVLLPDNNVENSGILIGRTGLYKFYPSNEHYEKISTDPRLNNATVNDVIETTHDIWIGSWLGLFKYNKITKGIELFNDEPGKSLQLPISTVQSLMISENNHLWIGTRGGGLVNYDLNTNKYWVYKKIPFVESSISDDAILSMTKSKSGILWFGTYLGGATKLTVDLGVNRFAHYLPGYVIMSFFKAKDKLYVGTRYKGLIELDETTLAIKEYLPTINGKEVQFGNSIFYITPEIGTSNLLVGTEGAGVLRFNKQTKNWSVFNKQFNNVFSIYTDKSNNYWCGTWGSGIIIIDNNGNIIRSITKKDGLSSDIIPVLYHDSQGIIWAGTKNGGVNRIDFINYENLKITIIKDFATDTSTSRNIDAFSIHEDISGDMWFGTMGSGLIRYNKQSGSIKVFDEKTGFKSNMIYGILSDKQHNIWLSTSKGLIKFNTKIEKLTDYDMKDGVQEEQFGMGAYFSDKEGQLYFGGINGYNAFYPDSIRNNINRHIPPIVITDFKVLNQKYTSHRFTEIKKEIALGKVILNHKENDLYFEFAALDYTFPSRNLYKYKLEGYDKEWVETNADNRIARYTNLRAGNYVFRVKGCNNDDVWNDDGTALYITIINPFWLTTWFILIIILIISAAIIFFIRQYTLKVGEEKEEVVHKTQESLFTKENQLRTLVDNLPDFIYIKDIESRFVLANITLSRVMIGSEGRPEKLIGKRDHDFYDADLADQFLADEQSIMQTGMPLINRIEPGIDEHGNDRIVSTTKVPIRNASGDVIGMVGIGRDITELIRAEEKIKVQAEYLQEANSQLEEQKEEIIQQKEELELQRNELERLNVTKSKLFSIIGHDLKNPFHAIISLSSMLTKQYESIEDNEKKEMIEMIKTSSEHAYELLENLLQWSKTQTNKVTFSPESVDLQNLVKKNFDLLQLNAEKKNIQLINNIKAPVNAFADPNMLNTIVRNLINNAIKFTPIEGKVIISCEEKKARAIITIEDTGVGMTKEQISKLFKIGENRSTSGTSGEAGTGLGLIICKEFIDKTGGEILVESDVDKGSRFILSLPIR